MNKIIFAFATTFFFTTSVAAENFKFTKDVALNIYDSYVAHSPVPLPDIAATSGMKTSLECYNLTTEQRIEDSVACGAVLCTDLQATYRYLINLGDCSDRKLGDKAVQKKCKGAAPSLGTAQNFFKATNTFCKCKGKTSCKENDKK